MKRRLALVAVALTILGGVGAGTGAAALIDRDQLGDGGGAAQLQAHDGTGNDATHDGGTYAPPDWAAFGGGK